MKTETTLKMDATEIEEVMRRHLASLGYMPLRIEFLIGTVGTYPGIDVHDSHSIEGLTGLSAQVEREEPSLRTKQVLPGGCCWVAQEHIDEGDTLAHGNRIIGRAIERCAPGAHVKEPIDREQAR